jgi:hypothetical protein
LPVVWYVSAPIEGAAVTVPGEERMTSARKPSVRRGVRLVMFAVVHSMESDVTEGFHTLRGGEPIMSTWRAWPQAQSA